MNPEENMKRHKEGSCRANITKEHTTLLNISDHLNLQLKDLKKEEQILEAMIRREEELLARLQAPAPSST